MIGETILHYKIQEKLGEGGMGVVYLAVDTRLKRKVAIKFLPNNISPDSEQRIRLETEAQAAASFNHPNITTIYAIEEYGDNAFIVMEYIDGTELKEKINSGALPLSEALSTASQIAEGINSAHKKGVIHRDIKSQNIMITSDGKVKIMDFGLAKITSDTQITRSGSTLGTAAYMSPEQARGEETDERSDIFSYGIVLYEMLTGALPFKGDYEYALIYSIINEEPDQTLLDNSAVPHKLRNVVLKCLYKDKRQRYQSFDDILKDLAICSMSSQVSSSGVTSAGQILLKSYKPQNDGSIIGREQELKIVISLIENAKRNRGSAVFINGEPGIGKTQFITSVIDHYSSNELNFLYGRCLFNNEGGLPYHPFVSAVNGSLFSGHGHFISTIELLAEKKGVNISNKMPQIKTFLNFSGEYSKSIMHKEQLWEAVLTMFAVIASDKPLVLILDDLQWADKTSVGLFAYLARNIRNLPALLIGLCRAPEIASDDADLTGTIRQLRIEDAASKVDLLRLSETDTLQIIRKILGQNSVDSKIVSEIYRQSEGNPLFIYELTRLMKDRKAIKQERDDSWVLDEQASLNKVSDKVQDVIKQRVERLEDELREVLQFASCQGEYFQSTVLTDCLKLDKISLLKMLQHLEKEYNIIHYENKNYRFDHILIREVLYESILPELREEYHKLIADSLIKTFGSKDEYAPSIAHHLLAGGAGGKAVTYLLTAAKTARELYAVEEAFSFYNKLIKIDRESGLDVPCRKSMEEGLGDINLFTGNPGQALLHFTSFSELAKTSNDIIGKIRALRKSAECYRITGKLIDAEKLCSEAVALGDENNAIGEMIESRNTLAAVYASKADYEKMISVSNKSLGYCRQLNDYKNLSVCLSNLGTAYWHLGNYPVASSKLNEAVLIQRNIGDTRGLSTTLNFLALASMKQGRFEDALKAGIESIDIKTKIGDGQKIPGGLNAIGDIYREIGDVDKAIEYHQKSLALAKKYNNKGAMCDNIRDLGEDYFMKGDYDQSLKYYNEALSLASLSKIKWYETRTCISLAEFYLESGEILKAREYMEKGLNYSHNIGAQDLIIEAFWNKAKINSSEHLITEADESFKKAIHLSKSVSHQPFLWKLLCDYSTFLSGERKANEAAVVMNEAKDVTRQILNNISNEAIKLVFIRLVEKKGVKL